MCEKLEIGFRGRFFLRQRNFSKNFDFKKWCENEIEIKNEKICTRFRNRFTHKIQFPRCGLQRDHPRAWELKGELKNWFIKMAHIEPTHVSIETLVKTRGRYSGRPAKPAKFQPEPGWARECPTRPGWESRARARSNPIHKNIFWFSIYGQVKVNIYLFYFI